MTKRDYSYDYLRAFAAIMIVLCHICQGFGVSMEMGYYLGGTYVDVFLLLSAYLLGLSSRDKVADEPWRFMKKRTGRLVPTYYTFLTITFFFIFIFLGFDSLSGSQIMGHYLFLNWFWPSSRVAYPPLPQIGHLWFMSCIMLGYLLVMGWSVLAKKFPTLDTNRSWRNYVAAWIVISTILTMRIRFAVYPCTVLLGFMILFFRGREIMEYVRRVKPAILISLLVIGNLGGIIYYYAGGYGYPVFIFWINLLNALLWIACAPLIFNREKAPRAVLFISAISFEVYLIHHPFCLGAYSLKQFMPVWVAAIAVFCISIVGGWILSILTKRIINIISHVNRKNPVA